MYEKFEKYGARSNLGTTELVGYCLFGSLSRDSHLLQQEDQPQDFIVGAAELQRRFILSNVRHLTEKEWEPEKWDGDIWIEVCEEKRDYTPERRRIHKTGTGRSQEYTQILRVLDKKAEHQVA